MKKVQSIIWLIIPIIVLVFLYQMALLGKIPLASDTISIQPIKEWKQKYFSSNEEFPHWYPYSFSGMPSYGSYIYTPGDPSSVILKTVLFNRGLKYWFHFTLGGLGIYFLLRRKKIGFVSALFGGVVFALTPYLFGLINAGHSTKIIAISYIPWIIMAADYCIIERKPRGILFLGVASALQLWSNHPQIVYYTWMLVVFWWLWNQSAHIIKKNWTAKRDGLVLGLVLGGLILALALVSDPYISVFEFQQHSNRGAPSVLDTTDETESGTKWDYATQWSFHPKETISFLYPYFYGLQNYPTRDLKSVAYWGFMPFTQSTHYLGLLVIMVAILGALIRKPDRFSLFLWVSSVLVLLVGFGRYFPVIYGPLFKLAPFFSKFRVPSMIYILLAFTFSFLAAQGLENILDSLKSENHEGKVRLKSRLLIIFGLVIGFTLILVFFGESFISFVKPGESGRFSPQVFQQILDLREELFMKGLLTALVIAGIGFSCIWFGLQGKVKSEIVGYIIIGLTVFDLWYIDKDFLHLKAPAKMEGQFIATPEVDFLLKDKSHFRILPLDDLSTNWYGYFGLSSVGGYRPVKLRTYQDMMDLGGLNNLSVLNMLNVKYLITKNNINHPNFKLDYTGQKNIYLNLNVLPKAWMVTDLITANSQLESLQLTLDKEFNPGKQAVVCDYQGSMTPSENPGTVKISNYRENEIVLNSTSHSDGLVVLSEMYYKPGWKASIDGNPTKIYQTNHILRSVVAPAGEHEIRFWYDDRTWKVSRMLSRFFLLLTFIIIGWIYRSNLVSWVSRIK